jgi:hypothetical protein
MDARSVTHATPLARPGAIVAIAALVLVQTYRVSALDLAQSALTTTGSQPWFVPALADFGFGITAPFVGFALLRLTGLGVWVGGIVWLALSLFDFVDGFATNLAVGPPAQLGVSAGDATTVLLGWIALDIVALALLGRAAVRAHYLVSRARPSDG